MAVAAQRTLDMSTMGSTATKSQKRGRELGRHWQRRLALPAVLASLLARNRQCSRSSSSNNRSQQWQL
jgi:hypothetical protein